MTAAPGADVIDSPAGSRKTPALPCWFQPRAGQGGARPQCLCYKRLTMTTILPSSIAEMGASIRAKIISPVEMVEAHLLRAARYEGRLHAVVHWDAERACAQARRAEAALL